MNEMAITCKFSAAEYRVLERIARSHGTQVHNLIEALTRKALNPPRTKQMHAVEIAADVKRLHGLNLNDRQISEELGIPYSTANSIRNRLKLPANDKRGGRRKTITEMENAA